MYRSDYRHRMKLRYDNRKAAKRMNDGYYVQANEELVLVADWSSGSSGARRGP